MSSSFRNADKRTHRKIMLVGLLFCAAFVAFSFFAREQPENTYSRQSRQTGPYRGHTVSRQMSPSRCSNGTRSRRRDYCV
jgi:hypothetical protein